MCQQNCITHCSKWCLTWENEAHWNWLSFCEDQGCWYLLTKVAAYSQACTLNVQARSENYHSRGVFAERQIPQHGYYLKAEGVGETLDNNKQEDILRIHTIHDY